MEKGFFKVFIPEISAKRLKLPTGYIDYKNGILPRNVSLRDRFGNMWPIGVTKSEKHIYFEHGWDKFIEDNIVEFGDFIIFDYDGTRIFDFKLLGRTGCVKKGAGDLKFSKKKEDEEEINVDHQKSMELKENTWARDSTNSSSSNNSDEDNMVEEQDDRYEEYEETKKALCSKCRYSKEKEEDDDDEKDEYKEEEEEENERDGIFNKQTPCSKVECKRASAGKVNDPHEKIATDIFRNGCITKPKNPYFVTKIRPDRRDHLYIPADVVRDYKLELPSSMTIRDSAGREFEAKLKIWKDGRIWLVGGWRSLCRWNIVEKNDTCICEFVRRKHNKDLYLQIHIVYEGEGSHPNKK
ncbi:B3 domain-containing protein At5g60140-like [Solanum dulcamara]|uniref:B3 domain-containing protein At5g60140-like n=1 Tax=Solanum dulcamara TaxID=45834 RepID=UPI002485C778|nr:B3 domain-containing protein At5g60140-like [Solanum dulcamara]